MEQLIEPSLREHYRAKVEKYKYVRKGELYVLFSENITINNCDIKVIVEYDDNRPEYGIYYGIKMNKGEQLNDIDNIKSYFLNNWWLQKHPYCSESEGNKIFIKGDTDISADNTFWPFWIRLEDYRNISEAIEAAEVIYNYLSGNFLSHEQ